MILWDIRKANGPLMTLDQHNGSRASSDPSGSVFDVSIATVVCVLFP